MLENRNFYQEVQISMMEHDCHFLWEKCFYKFYVDLYLLKRFSKKDLSLPPKGQFCKVFAPLLRTPLLLLIIDHRLSNDVFLVLKF